MWHGDLLRTAISVNSMTAVPRPRWLLSGLRNRRLLVFLLGFDARVLQYLLGLFRTGLGPGQQEFAQTLKSNLSFAQQLRQIAQSTDRGSEFLISGLPQRFPHPLQQCFQL